MDPRLSRWEADAVLADGGTVHLRPIRPDDGPHLAAFHERLSPESVHFRFFTAMPRLPPAMLERFVHVDYQDRMALVGVLGDQLVAVARYERTPGSGSAEVAFVVDDRHQGRGLGTLLLEHLAAYAREHGITSFEADVLPANARMLQLFADAGFAEERSLDEGVVRVRFPISPTPGSIATMWEREHQAAARSIKRLLAPASVAVVGASREPGTIGHEVFRNLLDGRFAGPVFPVHPTAPHVASVLAYRSVLDIPGEVDLAVIVVPAPAVTGVVEQCAAKGVRGLVVISSGFAEVGPEGAAAERRLVEVARGNGMRLVGPNCMGVVNTDPAVRMNATFAPFPPVAGRVAFMSQSGALGISVLEEAGRRGIGVSTFVSAGNKADVSGNDLLAYWEDDPATDVVLLYLESFGNPHRFSRVARRISRVKPVVAVKSGRTGAGSRAASSHTAALASPDVVVDALFRQTGVIRVDTLEQLFDVAALLAHQPLPPGRRVAIVGNAGGPGILAADACEGAGLVVPELSPQTQASLRAFLPTAAAVRNPVDLVASASAADYERALRIVLADDAVDAVIVIFIPPLVTRPEDVAVAVSAAATGAGRKPVLANFLAVSGVAAAHGQSVLPAGVPSYAFPESAALALARAAACAEWRRRPEGTVPAFPDADRDAARAAVDAALAAHPDGTWLDPSAAAALAATYGVPVAPTVRVASAEEAADAAKNLGGPVVIKAANPDLVHKSDVGGVRLGLESPEDVADAYRSMEASLGPGMGGAVVQAMCSPGVETIVGVVQDPSFGPLVMFGTGGTAVELMGDRSFRVLPLTDLDAAELVRSVRGSPMLFGYRGVPAADVPALEDLLCRVGRMAEDLPEIVEADLNPVIVSPSGSVAVDVKVRLAPAAPRPDLATRRLR